MENLDFLTNLSEMKRLFKGQIFILGLDGLEYNFVEKWGLEALKQKEYGKIKIPIDKEQGVPETPEVWAAFLTGKYISDLEFVKPLRIAIPLKILRFLRRYIRISLGLGRKIETKAPHIFPKLKEKSFLDLTNSKEINAPYYSYDSAAFNILNQFSAEKLTLKECVETLKALYKKRKKQILYEIEKIQDADVVFAYMHFPDILQHFLFNKPLEIKRLYIDLDNYVSILKNRIKASLFLIVSDHGFDLKTENHSKHGFYSSNISLNPKPKQITDFFKIISSYNH